MYSGMGLPSGKVKSQSVQVWVSTIFNPLWVRVEYARARNRPSGDQAALWVSWPGICHSTRPVGTSVIWIDSGTIHPLTY